MVRNGFNAIDVKNECVNDIKQWFDINGKGCNAVIGISGGKDSTIVAALCVECSQDRWRCSSFIWMSLLFPHSRSSRTLS